MKEGLHPILAEALEFQTLKLGLDRISMIDGALGYPSRGFASAHIAGTNGKGSVTTKIARALEENGKKIGLYTSPHIATFHERIQINGIPISDERVDLILKKILYSGGYSLSYFELLTLLAFCYFSEEKVDFAVIETGLGGRLDATNIINPVLSIITSIEYDHMLHLGATLEAIAYEKGGIIKPGVPILIGPHAQPSSVFEELAAQAQSPLFQVTGDFSHYEEENRAVARKGLDLLPFPLEKRSIEIGLTQTPPCRFEIISSDHPTLILDAAHNPNGLARTFERLNWLYPERKVRVLAGFSADKDIQRSLSIIHKNAIQLHLTHLPHPRLAPLGDPSFERTFNGAFNLAKKNGEILLICGSFFIMHQARLLSKLALGLEGD